MNQEQINIAADEMIEILGPAIPGSENFPARRLAALVQYFINIPEQYRGAVYSRFQELFSQQGQ